MKDEIEEVLNNQLGTDVSRSSGQPIAFGITRSGRLIAVVCFSIFSLHEPQGAEAVYRVLGAGTAQEASSGKTRAISGYSFEYIHGELSDYLKGWRGYFTNRRRDGLSHHRV